MDARANFLSKMFQTGGYTVNEIRKQIGTPKYDHENADKPLVQINLQSIDAFNNKPKQPDKNTNLVEEEPAVEEKKSKKTKVKASE
jgi:hypothetical protein